jgi:cell division transport system permease protein
MMYHFRQSWLAARSNLTATLGTLATMTLTLTILALVVLLTLNLERISRSIERDVQITAWLKPDAKSDEVGQALQGMDSFESVAFVDKTEAYNRLIVDYAYFANASRTVENPLEDRYQIKLKSVNGIKAIADQIRAIPGVEFVEAGEGFVDNVVTAINTIRAFGYGLVGILLLNSLFNILNTIRVAMYARRDEINVMRLIGATRGFIRTPYVLEGAGLGALASLLTLLIVFPTYLQGITRLAGIVPFLELIREPVVVLQVLALLTVLGIMIGFLGSLFATNRYLREVE